MNKENKLAAVAVAITKSTRSDGTEFYHFADGAPESLRDLFLEHYSVRDLDYQTFGRACDVVAEVYAEKPKDITEAIYERSADSASVYTADRLAYLDLHNEDEISELMRECGEHSIATACAMWYDRQVEQAAILISEWVEAK